MKKLYLNKYFISKIVTSVILLAIWCIFYFFVDRLHVEFNLETSNLNFYDKFIAFLKWNVEISDLKWLLLNCIFLYIPIFILAVNLVPFIVNFILHCGLYIYFKVFKQAENYINFITNNDKVKYISGISILIKDLICFYLLALYLNNIALFISNSTYLNYVISTNASNPDFAKFGAIPCYICIMELCSGSVLIISRIFDRSGNQKQYDFLISNEINYLICIICFLIMCFVFYYCFGKNLDRYINLRNYILFCLPIIIVCYLILFIKNISRRKFIYAKSENTYPSKNKSSNKVIRNNKELETIPYMKSNVGDDYFAKIN